MSNFNQKIASVRYIVILFILMVGNGRQKRKQQQKIEQRNYKKKFVEADKKVQNIRCPAKPNLI